MYIVLKWYSDGSGRPTVDFLEDAGEAIRCVSGALEDRVEVYEISIEEGEQVARIVSPEQDTL